MSISTDFIFSLQHTFPSNTTPTITVATTDTLWYQQQLLHVQIILISLK